MEESQFFDEVISECSVTEYFTLYNELATQIGIFYDELFGLKSILRLIEAKKSPQKLLRDYITEITHIDNTVIKYATQVDEKFGTNLIELINS
jgi:hypothetical protein